MNVAGKALEKKTTHSVKSHCFFSQQEGTIANGSLKNDDLIRIALSLNYVGL